MRARARAKLRYAHFRDICMHLRLPPHGCRDEQKAGIAASALPPLFGSATRSENTAHIYASGVAILFHFLRWRLLMDARPTRRNARLALPAASRPAAIQISGWLAVVHRMATYFGLAGFASRRRQR